MVAVASLAAVQEVAVALRATGRDSDSFPSFPNSIWERLLFRAKLRFALTSPFIASRRLVLNRCSYFSCLFLYLDNYLNIVTKLFRALDDPTRRRILELLRERELSVGEIGKHFVMSLPSISYHLDLLRQADLVVSEKRGQFVHYTLNTSVLDETLAWLTGLMATGCRPTYETQRPAKKRRTATGHARRAFSGPHSAVG
jgi:ArsR family transcriptional regulator